MSVVLTYRLACFSVCLFADHRYTTFEMASENQSDPVSFISWSPDGKYIASGVNNGITHVRDVTTGHAIYTYDTTSWIGWSPNGKYILLNDGTLHVIETQTGKEVFTYKANINAVQWSSDGKYLALAVDNTVQVWQAE